MGVLLFVAGFLAGLAVRLPPDTSNLAKNSPENQTSKAPVRLAKPPTIAATISPMMSANIGSGAETSTVAANTAPAPMNSPATMEPVPTQSPKVSTPSLPPASSTLPVPNQPAIAQQNPTTSGGSTASSLPAPSPNPPVSSLPNPSPPPSLTSSPGLQPPTQTVKSAPPIVSPCVSDIPIAEANGQGRGSLENGERLFSVQLGAFRDSNNAARMLVSLNNSGCHASVFRAVDIHNRIWNAVRLGPYRDFQTASRAADELKRREGLLGLVRPADSL